MNTNYRAEQSRLKYPDKKRRYDEVSESFYTDNDWYLHDQQSF